MDASTTRHTRPVSAPQKPLPPGAWDCHAHVFGPFDRFPLLPNRRWSPPLAPADDYLAMLDAVGFANGVVVHSWVNGFDNSGAGSGIRLAPDRVRGVAVLPRDASDDAFARLHADGFRAIRFNEIGRQPVPGAGSATLDDLDVLAPRMRAFGWQAHLWVSAATSLAASTRLRACGLPIVFDHMGYFDVTRGVGDPVFQDLLRLMRDLDAFVKMTPIRVSKDPIGYSDVRPFHDALVSAMPDRLVFGTDWPYISLDDAPPDAGKLVDLFDRWTRDEAVRQAVFVTNPGRLFA
jgi:predicted TIM-barrel fold metal-dependent hydrolase